MRNDGEVPKAAVERLILIANRRVLMAVAAALSDFDCPRLAEEVDFVARAMGSWLGDPPDPIV